MIHYSSHDPVTVKAMLNQRGMRLTAQRQIILNIFQALSPGQHLSADNLYQRLKSQGERISSSTVYRTLHMMSNMGLLRELELAEGSKFYELNHPYLKQHHHLVCVRCGRVTEFEDDVITQIGSNQANAEGFHLLDSQLTIYALCPQCQAMEPI